MTVLTPRVVKDDKHWLDPPWWWKKYRPMRWIAIAIIVFGLFTIFWKGAELVMVPSPHAETARYLKVEKNGVKLAGLFKSYSSVDQVTTQLDKDNLASLRNRNHRPPSDRYPPRDLDTLTVAPYTHLGSEGTLTLEFFNDRLYEAHFQPKDAGGYAEALHKVDGRLKRDRIGKAEYKDGALRVASNVDLAKSDVGISLGTKPYVIWQDTRLIQLREEWDAAYGSIPVQR